MELSERLYQECSCVLRTSPTARHVRTRGPGTVLMNPLIWESILLTIHFLCVVHAVHERDTFRRLAELWRARRHRNEKPLSPDPLMIETSEALQTLENELQQRVIRPLQDQIEAARGAVHQILVTYGGAKGLPSDAASQIVSKVVETLEEHTTPQA